MNLRRYVRNLFSPLITDQQKQLSSYLASIFEPIFLKQLSSQIRILVFDPFLQLYIKGGIYQKYSSLTSAVLQQRLRGREERSESIIDRYTEVEERILRNNKKRFLLDLKIKLYYQIGTFSWQLWYYNMKYSSNCGLNR